jgi:geranylgeranylglycerol-phosphate geranylgeranyltransferase
VGSAGLWLAAFIAGIITAFGNITNDYFDIEIDRINKPNRILPLGKLLPRQALWIGIFLSVIAISLGFFLRWDMGLIALLMVVVAFLYSWKLKKTFLLGNIIISLMTALTFIFGSLFIGKIGHAWIPALIVLFFMLAREILKTVEDINGDEKVGARTIAILWGKSRALDVFTALAIIVALFIPIPWIIRDVSAIYLVLTIPFVSIVLLFVMFWVKKQPSNTVIKNSLIVTKGSWIIWAIAMCLGLWLR